jgi:pyruvate dehydrogenase (quinone)
MPCRADALNLHRQAGHSFSGESVMAHPTIAALLVDTLARAGVRRIYGVVGDSLNPISDAIRAQDTIEWIHVRHEEAGAFAAGAEAQLSGQLTVCAGSCGPGNLHLINGLYDSHRSGAPVLAIAAQVPSSEIGTGFFQETHPERLFVECSHYCELISSPDQMPRVLQTAMQHAIGRGGVAVVVLPGDVAAQSVPDVSKSHGLAVARAAVRPADADLRQLAAMLDAANRVTFLCGIGCAGAHDAVMQLADRVKAPIVHSLRGKESIEPDNPFDVGMTGLIGMHSGYAAMESCDLLLMLGTDFPYDDWYPAGPKIVQVDIRAERLGRRSRLDLGLVGDVGDTLSALLPLVSAKSSRDHLDRALASYTRSRSDLDDIAHAHEQHRPIHPAYLASLIDAKAAPDAIFTVDVGMSTVWAARYLRMHTGRRLLGSFVHGSMANAMSQGIGAKLLYPDRQVIALCGDGGFSMLMGDVLTLLQHKIALKLVIFNNHALGMVQLEQAVAGYANFGVDLVNPNFAKLAEAIGMTGIRVEDPSAVSDAVDAALRTTGPVLLDVVTDAHVLSMPPHTTFRQAREFSLYMVKEVLAGNGAELLDYARANAP